MPAATMETPATVQAAAAMEATTATVAVTAAVVASSVAVEPGAGADEGAAYEPVRSVEAIGRTGVWIIVVVAVGADGSRPVIHGSSYTDAEGDALGLRAGSREETNGEKNAE